MIRRSHRWTSVFAAVCLTLITATEPAHADRAGDQGSAPEPASDSTDAATSAAECDARPWACNVSPRRRARALALYKAGNQLLEDALFSTAAGKYSAALEHWDHPAIHYKLGLALYNQEKLVAAYQSFVRSLRHGPDALEPDDYQRALEHERQLRERIAVIEVACDEPGAVVSLNGAPLFTAPGRVTQYVLPGDYQVAARKPKYMVATQALTLRAAEVTRVSLTLVAEDQAQVHTRRMAAWKPWSVIGLAAGLGTTGALLHWRAGKNQARFDELFLVYCPSGCPESALPASVRAYESRARWQRRFATASYGVASVSALLGAGLIYHNRVRTRDNPALEHMVEVSVTPVLAPDLAGLSVQASF